MVLIGNLDSSSTNLPITYVATSIGLVPIYGEIYDKYGNRVEYIEDPFLASILEKYLRDLYTLYERGIYLPVLGYYDAERSPLFKNFLILIPNMRKILQENRENDMSTLYDIYVQRKEDLYGKVIPIENLPISSRGAYIEDRDSFNMSLIYMPKNIINELLQYLLNRDFNKLKILIYKYFTDLSKIVKYRLGNENYYWIYVPNYATINIVPINNRFIALRFPVEEGSEEELPVAYVPVINKVESKIMLPLMSEEVKRGVLPEDYRDLINFLNYIFTLLGREELGILENVSPNILKSVQHDFILVFPLNEGSLVLELLPIRNEVQKILNIFNRLNKTYLLTERPILEDSSMASIYEADKLLRNEIESTVNLSSFKSFSKRRKKLESDEYEDMYLVRLFCYPKLLRFGNNLGLILFGYRILNEDQLNSRPNYLNLLLVPSLVLFSSSKKGNVKKSIIDLVLRDLLTSF